MTHTEFIKIEARTHSNPREVKSHVLEDIRADRLRKGLQNLPSSTFYRAMKQTDLYQFLSEATYPWFTVRRIKIPTDYSVYDERDTLSTLGTFSNFETQLAYVVECTDLFVTDVIHRKGKIHQSLNARRQNVENQIRKEELEPISYKSRDMILAHKPDRDGIHKIAYPAIDEKIRARFELLRANKDISMLTA